MVRYNIQMQTVIPDIKAERRFCKVLQYVTTETQKVLTIRWALKLGSIKPFNITILKYQKLEDGKCFDFVLLWHLWKIKKSDLLFMLAMLLMTAFYWLHRLHFPPLSPISFKCGVIQNALCMWMPCAHSIMWSSNKHKPLLLQQCYLLWPLLHACHIAHFPLATWAHSFIIFLLKYYWKVTVNPFPHPPHVLC